MRKHEMTLPELGLIGFTRGMIGFGIGLLAAGNFKRDRRKTIGAIALAVGALSTIPIAWRVFRKKTDAVRDEVTGYSSRRAQAASMMAD
jgi:hypothetical protein